MHVSFNPRLEIQDFNEMLTNYMKYKIYLITYSIQDLK